MQYHYIYKIENTYFGHSTDNFDGLLILSEIENICFSIYKTRIEMIDKIIELNGQLYDKVNKEKQFNFLYKITNNVNNKYYYGVHVTNELNDSYFGSGTFLKSAIKKHGKENFSKSIKKLFITREEMFLYEKQLITINMINDQNCYNIGKGGLGGQLSGFTKDNNASLAQMADKIRGRTKETYAGFMKLSIALTGRTKDEYEYLRLAGLKRKGRTKKNNSGYKTISEKLTGRNKENTPYIAEMAEKLRGRTKETHPYLASKIKGKTKENNAQLAKISKALKGRTKETHTGVAQMAEKLRGRTKETHSSIAKMAETLTGRTALTTSGLLTTALKLSKGIYITPFGNFYSENMCVVSLNSSYAGRYCTIYNNDIANNNGQVSMCIEFLSNYEGKTYKELGFGFISYPENCVDKKQFCIDNNVIFDTRNILKDYKENFISGSGIFVTPFGVFTTSASCAKELSTTKRTIDKYCKHKNHIKLSASYKIPNFTLLFNYNNKTPNELGFGFINYPKNCKNRKQFCLDNGVIFD